MAYCRLTLRPALFLRSSSARLIDQKIIELFSLLDRSDEPTGFRAATCPSLARWTSIFRWDFSPAQRAYPYPAEANRFVANRTVQSCQLLFEVRATLQQSLVNPLAQVREESPHGSPRLSLLRGNLRLSRLRGSRRPSLHRLSRLHESRRQFLRPHGSRRVEQKLRPGSRSSRAGQQQQQAKTVSWDASFERQPSLRYLAEPILNET